MRKAGSKGKKRNRLAAVLLSVVMAVSIAGFSDGITGYAQEMQQLIQVSQNTKDTYHVGEEVELKDIRLEVKDSQNTGEVKEVSAAQLQGVLVFPQETGKTLKDITATYGIHNICVRGTAENGETKTLVYGIKVVPSVVTGLKQTSAGENSITLAWDRVTDAPQTTGSVAIGYQILGYQKDSGRWSAYIYGGPSRENLSVDTCVHELNQTQLENAVQASGDGNRYCFKVRSFYKVYYTGKEEVPQNLQKDYRGPDQNGRYYVACYSAASETVQCAVKPVKPTDFKVTAAETSRVLLSWAPQAHVTGYILSRAIADEQTKDPQFTEIATLKAEQTVYEDKAVAEKTKYIYQLKAFSEYGTTGAQVLQKCTGEAATIATVTADSQTGRAAIVSIKVDKTKSQYRYIKNEPYKSDGLVVTATYADKTTAVLSPEQYTIYPKVTEQVKDLSQITSSYGTHKIHVAYTGAEVPADSINCNYEIYVRPETVKNVKQTAATANSITLRWDAVPGVTGYQICEYDAVKGKTGTEIYGGPKRNNIPAEKTEITLTNTMTAKTALKYAPAQSYHYVVRAFYKDFSDTGSIDISGKTYRGFDGENSQEITAYTAPAKVKNLLFYENTEHTITVKWDAVAGADGYIVTTQKQGTGNEVVAGRTEGNTNVSYTISGLEMQTQYQIKVSAYKGNTQFLGADSDPVNMMTQCQNTTLAMVKKGESKIRLKWDKVADCTGYYIYRKMEPGEYKLVETIADPGKLTYTAGGLVPGKTYSFQVCAYKDISNTVNGAQYVTSYKGSASNAITVTMQKIPKTSQKAKRYPSKTAFLKSPAYKRFTFFRKYLKYRQSYVIPGLRNTNVAGFESYAMQPKAAVFMKQYLLISASDGKKEENSVLYVLDKSTHKLQTTICLPDKAKAEALAYDGRHVWVGTGSAMAALSGTKIAAAAKKKMAYYSIKYETKCKVKTGQPQFATIYGDRLWIGTAGTKKSVMYGYTIQNKKTTKPVLVAKTKMQLGSYAAGVAFAADGTLFVSRMHGVKKQDKDYIHTLETYRPVGMNKTSGTIVKGKRKKSITLPPGNRSLIIQNGCLYVTFCSANIEKAEAPVDRVCALDIAGLK